MAIISIIGNQGDGKSTLMTHMLYEAHKKGITVYSNYGLSFVPEENIKSIEEMMQDPDALSNSFTAVDEAHIAVDSRKFFSSKNEVFTQWITQLRKRGITLLVATQRQRLVDVRLRTQYDYVFYPSHIEPFWREGTFFDSLFEVVVQNAETGGVVNEFILDAHEVFEKKLFDTTEIIGYENRNKIATNIEEDKEQITSEKEGVDMGLTNKEKVDNWRQNKGNEKRKNNYHMLRNLGIHWKEARKMQFWSDERIEEYILEHKVVDKDE